MAWVDTGNSTAFATDQNAPVSQTYPNNCVSGSLLLAMATWGTGTVTDASVSDPTNNAWQIGIRVADSSHAQCIGLFYVNGNISTAALVVTLAVTGNPATCALSIWEKTGQATSNVLDGSASQANVAGSTSANADNSTSFSTTVDGDLIVGGIMDTAAGANHYTAGTSPFTFTNRSSSFSGAMQPEDGVQTTHGSVSAAWTGNGTNNYTAFAVAFKPVGASAGNSAVAMWLKARRMLDFCRRESGLLVPGYCA